MRRLCLIGLLVLALVPLSAQQPAPASQPTQPVFKTSSTLATLDAVVTDDQGRAVTDLTKDDFEVTVSRKRQELQQAVFIRANTPVSMAPSPIGTENAAAPPPPRPGSASAVLKASTMGTGRITRTIAFVVDDLSLSFESTFAVRKALSKYVESELGPGDLVAIIRTASGVGALQQFTSDKRLLKLAVDRVQWDSRSRRGVSSFEPMSATYLTSPLPGPQSTIANAPGSDPASTEKIDGLRRTMTGVGSLSAVEFIAQGVQRLPGRKSIVLLSEGFAEMFQERMEGGLLWNALTRMLDNVNRAGIVLYTIDARGLQTSGLTAEDNGVVRDWGAPTGAGGPGGGGIVPGNSENNIQDVPLRNAQSARNNERINSQESLQFIADQTGGLAFMNTNDIGRAIDKALADQQGYYLLGYTVPPDTPLTGWNQGAVHISVKRPHTHVRTRQGFFGPASPRDAVKTVTDPLLVAALTPFANADVSARLTSDFWHDGKQSSVQSMFFVDANDIAFSQTPDGHRTAQLELGILAVDDNGQVTASNRKTTTWNLTDEQYKGALDHGIVYRSRLFVDRPGAYQIRAAIRDVTTGRTGSSSQFLVIPQVGKGKLALSGLMLKGFADTSVALDVAPLEVATTSLSVETLLGPTIRILNPGSKAVYAYEIYDGLGDTENLEMSTTLFRHGKAVYQSPVQPVKVPEPDKKISVISIGGALDLGKDMPSGPYSLQVDVQRKKGNGKIDRRASQWVDFEIRR